MQLEALKLSGEELRRAKAALAGPNSSRDAEVGLQLTCTEPYTAGPQAHQKCSLHGSHLVRQHLVGFR